MEPHFDFEDDRVYALICENTDLISTGHCFTQICADCNLSHIPLLYRNGLITEMGQALDLVANVENQESFKINFLMGFILMKSHTGRYQFFVSHENNIFFKKPIRID